MRMGLSYLAAVPLLQWFSIVVVQCIAQFAFVWGLVWRTSGTHTPMHIHTHDAQECARAGVLVLMIRKTPSMQRAASHHNHRPPSGY